MNTLVIQRLLVALLSMLTPQLVKTVVDKVLDIIEASVMKSDNKMDDAVILPLIKTIRVAISVPDNDAK